VAAPGGTAEPVVVGAAGAAEAPAAAGEASAAGPAGDIAARGFSGISWIELPANFGAAGLGPKDGSSRIGSMAVHAVRTISRGRLGTGDGSVAADRKKAADATAAKPYTQRRTLFTRFITRIPVGPSSRWASRPHKCNALIPNLRPLGFVPVPGICLPASKYRPFLHLINIARSAPCRFPFPLRRRESLAENLSPAVPPAPRRDRACLPDPPAHRHR
jgi:hypothetical protein